jgi:GNAT superfamily N-acetyltransferase
MNVAFRKAVLDDTSSLVDILTDAVKYKLKHDDISWGEEPYSEREVRGLIKTGETYAVLSEDLVIGTFGLHWKDERIWGVRPDDAGYIHRLAIRDNLHGHDIGQQIINWAVSEVARQGRNFLRLDTDSRNSGLCKYYEKQGFINVGKVLIPSSKDYFATLYERQI